MEHVKTVREKLRTVIRQAPLKVMMKLPAKPPASHPNSEPSEHTQLDCGPDPTSPALRACSASFVKIFFPAMRPDAQAPVI